VATFFCLDGHTCGNPVRLVVKGAPDLKGGSMSEKRQDFLDHHDWIRQSLMFEPRGHDLMSGAFIYPATSDDADIALLFIETSGCLPMCGHGAIGAITMGLEYGLIQPAQEGVLVVDVPAGKIQVEYLRSKNYVEDVRLYNTASYLAAEGLTIDVPGLGILAIDVAYGGNFYAIVDPQKNYPGLQDLSAAKLLHLSPLVREKIRQIYEPIHPQDQTICGVSHVMWTGQTLNQRNHGRNAVFYGEKAIDRSPCGTGTSARMAQWVAKGQLAVGSDFIHESIIGSSFKGRVESSCKLGSYDAIMPSFSGWARLTGMNHIIVDQRDPFWSGFQVV